MFFFNLLIADSNELLAKHSEWRGEITQLYLGIYGNLRNEPFIFESIVLNPYSLNLALQMIPAQWLSSTTWRGSSINYSTGTISGKHLPPGLFFGLLFSLSLVFVELLKKLLNNSEKTLSIAPRALTYVTVIVILCAGQDFHRIIGRFEQAMETNRVFAGKTLAERAAATPLRCAVMEVMIKGYNTIDGPSGEIYKRYGFDCGQDAPLPNF